MIENATRENLSKALLEQNASLTNDGEKNDCRHKSEGARCKINGRDGVCVVEKARRNKKRDKTKKRLKCLEYGPPPESVNEWGTNDRMKTKKTMALKERPPPVL